MRVGREDVFLQKISDIFFIRVKRLLIYSEKTRAEKEARKGGGKKGKGGGKKGDGKDAAKGGDKGAP